MPDTYTYFIAGYAVIFGLLGAYIVYLAALKARLARLHREYEGEKGHED